MDEEELSRERHTNRFKNAATLCTVVAILLYWNSLDLTYSFDDHRVVLQNADIRTNETTWFDLLSNDFWGTPMSSPDSHKSYRPLTVATFRLNYMLHELEPLGYHLVNVLLHSAVCYLYVLLCGVVFSEVWPALIAGLLFAVHPIHTEAVIKHITMYIAITQNHTISIHDLPSDCRVSWKS